MRTTLFSMLVLLTFLAMPASGQTRFEFAAGGGLTLSGYSHFSSGPHALGSAAAYLGPTLAFRLDAFASIGGFEYEEFRFLTGPGYFHSCWSENTPPEHDLGWALGIGVQTDLVGREWFAELGRPRCEEFRLSGQGNLS